MNSLKIGYDDRAKYLPYGLIGCGMSGNEKLGRPSSTLD